VNILLSNSSNIYAGGEVYVLTLAGLLHHRSHRVAVSGQRGNLLLKKCEQMGIETIPLDFTEMAKVFSVAGQLRREIKRRGIEILHSNANYDRTCAAIAAAWTPAAHVATVHSAHSIQHNITHWLRNRYGTAHFIAVAEAVRAVLIGEDRIDPKNISVVANGVPDNTDSNGLRPGLRSTLGFSGSTVVVGNIARLVPFKGQQYLLTAISLLRQRGLDVRLLIAGEGELRTELEQQATSLGISSGVHFLGFRDDARDLYHACDLYCQPSIDLGEEAFPIAVLDAMASGLPVVGTTVGGIPGMIEEGQSGFLVPPGDPKSLADALGSLCADAERRKRFGAVSHDLFMKNYSADTMADAVEAIYEKVR
jgi:glycosyltransferase involved in cell wall biosynthesis